MKRMLAVLMLAFACGEEGPDEADCDQVVADCRESLAESEQACLVQADCASMQIGGCPHSLCVAECTFEDQLAECIARDATCHPVSCQSHCQHECWPDYFSCHFPDVEGLCQTDRDCDEANDACMTACKDECLAG